MSKHMCLTLTLEDLTHMVITYGLILQKIPTNIYSCGFFSPLLNFHGTLMNFKNLLSYLIIQTRSQEIRYHF